MTINVISSDVSSEQITTPTDTQFLEFIEDFVISLEVAYTDKLLYLEFDSAELVKWAKESKDYNREYYYHNSWRVGKRLNKILKGLDNPNDCAIEYFRCYGNKKTYRVFDPDGRLELAANQREEEKEKSSDQEESQNDT